MIAVGSPILADDFNALAVRKSSDETVNNSATLQNDDALVIAAAASTNYKFEAVLRYSTNSTANLKWAFAIPSGATLVYSALHIPAGGSSMTFTELINTATGTADDGLPYVWMRGVLTTVGNAGNLQLQWAQNTANASDTKIRDGSYLALTRMP